MPILTGGHICSKERLKWAYRYLYLWRRVPILFPITLFWGIFESHINDWNDWNVIPLLMSCRAYVKTSMVHFFMNFQIVIVLLTLVMFFMSPGNKTGSGQESHWKWPKCQNFTNFRFHQIVSIYNCSQSPSVARIYVWGYQEGVSMDSNGVLNAKNPIFSVVGAHF